jgi:hypothetical protein
MKPTTREIILREIACTNKRAERLDMPLSIGSFVGSVRSFLHMNGYEPWSDDAIAAIVKETPNLYLAEPPKSKPKPAEAESQSEAPELLPCTKLPGYLLDPWGIPYRQVGQGRKPGRVRLDNYFYCRKGEKKPRHIARYRLTIDGLRRAFYPKYLMMARLIAERERKQEKLVLRNSTESEVGHA